jgi:hypothetical protein
MARFLCVWVTIGAMLFTAACGRSLSGTYEGSGGMGLITSLEFKSGKVYLLSPIGGTVEKDYEVKDDKLIIKDAGRGENLVLKIEGELLTGGPLGMTFKKKA